MLGDGPVVCVVEGALSLLIIAPLTIGGIYDLPTLTVVITASSFSLLHHSCLATRPIRRTHRKN
jgi:hypothetical protein